jgi:hypothetical protein
MPGCDPDGRGRGEQDGVEVTVVMTGGGRSGHGGLGAGLIIRLVH